MDRKIKTCPFCGAEMDTVGFYAHPSNDCILRHASIDFEDEESIKKWNTRKPMDEIMEVISEIYHGVSMAREEAFEIAEGGAE